MGERRTIEEVNGGNNLIDFKNIDLDREAIHIHGRMEHNLVELPNITFVEAQKIHEVVNSQEKLIIVEEFFLDISK